MKLTKEEQQLWAYIEKHFKQWDNERFKALVTSIMLKDKVKGAT